MCIYNCDCYLSCCQKTQTNDDLCWLMNVPNEPPHEISNNVVCAINKASDQPAHTRSLIRDFASRLNIL